MHKFQCKCGALGGYIQNTGISNRIICYCADCQAFANFLGGDDVVDGHGGTEIVQIAQHRLKFSHGKDHLAVMRLRPNGLFRWYASCCNTAFGNTLGNPKLSFIGLIHSCLDQSAMDADFGKDIAQVNIESAIGEAKPKQKGLAGILLRFLRIVLSGRFFGTYKQSPLFNDAGMPVIEPRILSSQERSSL
ncbi:DUF6151 family protein [Zhongshania sp.]|uniref:DUF6151 family protein n=1 Tax=Zhongshania sp. TaxID=1971902 RepID=UPI00356A5669